MEKHDYKMLVRDAVGGDSLHYQLFLQAAPDIESLQNLSDEQQAALSSISEQMKAAVAAIKLGCYMVKHPRSLYGQAYSSMTLGKYLINEYAGDCQESVIVVCTDPHLNILARRKIFVGGKSECSSYPDCIFRYALLHNASGIVLAHNHPTGDVEPSDQDELFMSRMRNAGRLIGVPLVDFFIIGHDAYYSWLENQQA